MHQKSFVLSLWFGVAALAQPVYTAQTAAGSNPLGDGGPATNAVILNVNTVLTDSGGNVYIAENQGRVRRVGTNGLITTVAGTPGAAAGSTSGDGGPAVQAELNVPMGMAADSAGNYLYISEYQACRIRRVALKTGLISTYAGDGVCRLGQDGAAGSTSLYYPTGLLIDSQGRVVVAELLGNRIRRIDANGNVTTIAGNGTAGLAGNGGVATQAMIASPTSLTQDSKGNLFFVDSANCLVREIDINTTVLHTIAGTTCGFSGDGGAPLSAQLTPGALLVNPAGDTIYMSDAGTRVRKINLTANLITTYAGTGTSTLSSDGGLATQTPLAGAGSMAFASDGSLLIAQNFGVRRVSSGGIVGTFAGIDPEAGDGGSAPNAILAYPSYVAPDGKGGFVFNDQANGRIRAVTSAGVISTVAGIDEFSGFGGDGGPAKSAGIAFVRGITVDAAGNIYIAQGAFQTPSTFELRRITPSGTIDKFGTSAFALPTGLAVDPSQKFLYMTEFNGERIVKVDLASGSVTTFAGQGQAGTTGTAGFQGDGGPANNAQFSGPGQIAVDGAGNVYVFDGGNGRIRKISASGNLIQTVAGNGAYASTGDGGLATAASIAVFVGIAVDSAGNIFISEGNKIRRVDVVTGIINIIAGGSAGGFGGDGGPALLAKFADAEGMGIDSRGNVYIAELLNHRIRVLSPPGTAPFVTSIDTAGGFPDIAQNSWTEIKGANLGPATGVTWASAPEFAQGKMPTQLSNVSVTVNGKPAYMYYASATQINVLTPLDNTTGPVQIVVTNGANSSLAFTANLRPAAPSFLLLGSTKYDAAEHLNFALLGPTSLSVPGYSFTPAQAGETVVLFSTGFGLPTTALTAGSSTQSGALPSLPTVQIGGVAATVGFAGAISPGLYQLNVTVPTGLTSGDNSLMVSYGGLTSPLGVLLAIQ
jgi:uncharacterized protein (TIGR03437 family)